MAALLILCFSANLMAMLFSSVLEEYLLGISSSMKIEYAPALLMANRWGRWICGSFYKIFECLSIDNPTAFA